MSFIIEALSAEGSPSSKRMLAALAVVVAIAIIPVNILIKDTAIPLTHYFDGLLVFAAACLTGAVIENIKNIPNPPTDGNS
jgi:hypothetical protein